MDMNEHQVLKELSKPVSIFPAEISIIPFVQILENDVKGS